MRTLKSCMLAGVALGCFGLTGGANAQQVFGGGSTFAAPTYRLLMDCWGIPADGVGDDQTLNPGIVVQPVSPLCPSASGDASGLTAQILFAPTGSGGGKQALANHDPSTNTSTGLKTPGAANTVPFTSSFSKTYGYPALQFAGSDDPWLASDVTKYNAISGPSKYGKILEFPAFAGAATISFNSTGLTIANATPTGGSSGLNLSRQALCGIFSGHITKWNNPILTALNGGTTLGTGSITVVHRSDGSGTNFITTNALIAQCVGVTGPNNETDSHVASYQFPWTDRNVGTSVCNATAPLSAAAVGASTVNNWPDLTNDQCGVAISNPGGGTFTSASGSSGVVAKIQSTVGAIGYATTDYTQPVVATGPKNANIQNSYSIANAGAPGVLAFVPPTSATVTAAMDTSVPFFPPIVAEANDITNTLNWSLQTTNPNPVSINAYPLVGFTYFDFYQCFKNTNTPGLADSNNLNVIFSYLTYHYTDASAAAIMSGQGFAPISSTNLSNWYNAAVTLLSAGSSAMNVAGTGACSAVSPGA
ncbi:substrate-binding domain-containing protein [Bradyrhizobium manausense]|uniref:substrate-binding domain-containing protein n=1 Tax=Bradyrhizobium manausense TaxID=989370 RepID=UPI001BAD5478|nr:substrate-binding domain-containing protein [Bradyrhizobium manausense]MBR1089232.1 substrate-binding domain-containing protein [Bradyrhizobium manausense]